MQARYDLLYLIIAKLVVGICITQMWLGLKQRKQYSKD